LKSSLQRDPEGPSQPHVRPGTQSMSRLSNSKRHQPSLGSPTTCSTQAELASNMYKA
jgi:hypothetical protein